MSNEEVIEQALKEKDVKEIKNDIEEIRTLLQTIPWPTMNDLLSLINKINAKHPDNRFFYLILYPPTGQIVTLNESNYDERISDLKWKEKYLQAKAVAKAVEELYDLCKR